MRMGFVLAVCVAWVCSHAELRASSAWAEAPVSSEQAELDARIRTLQSKGQAEVVRTPAEQARLALERANALTAKNDDRGAARSLAIARAALALAEARSALLHERELFASATLRKQEAEQRAKSASAALARAKEAAPPSSAAQPPPANAPAANEHP